jgi:hypothetical protein
MNPHYIKFKQHQARAAQQGFRAMTMSQFVAFVQDCVL